MKSNRIDSSEIKDMLKILDNQKSNNQDKFIKIRDNNSFKKERYNKLNVNYLSELNKEEKKN